MPDTASVIDSEIYGGIFSTQAMRAVWSDRSRIQRYLDVEKALLVVQGRLGVIPRKQPTRSPATARLARWTSPS